MKKNSSYWYCPKCKEELDGCHVTYQELCEYCGTAVLSVPESISQETIEEIIKAKADGRLVELPCKIGDEVWFLEKQLDIANGTCSTVISEYIVTEIRGNKYNPLWYMASSERCTHRDFHPTELGKTVFLTKEAAEKALGGGESD
jgi:hypothetical protein